MARWGRCDYRQLQNLQRRIEQLQRADMDAFCRRMAKDLAARLLRKVKRRTPVAIYDKPVQFTTRDGTEVSFQPHTGKTGGTLRRGWDIGEVHKNGDTYEIEVINPTEYGPYVEFGHRTANHRGWVSGRFMLTMSEQELKAQGPALIQQKLYQFLKEELGW